MKWHEWLSSGPHEVLICGDIVMILSFQGQIMLATLHQPTTSVILTDLIKFLTELFGFAILLNEFSRFLFSYCFLSFTVTFSSENPKQFQALGTYQTGLQLEDFIQSISSKVVLRNTPRHGQKLRNIFKEKLGDYGRVEWAKAFKAYIASSVF